MVGSVLPVLAVVASASPAARDDGALVVVVVVRESELCECDRGMLLFGLLAVLLAVAAVLVS